MEDYEKTCHEETGKHPYTLYCHVEAHSKDLVVWLMKRIEDGKNTDWETANKVLTRLVEEYQREVKTLRNDLNGIKQTIDMHRELR